MNLNTIKVTIDREKNTITIWDNGGIPVVQHSEHKEWIPEMIFSNLKAGSNFDDTEERSWAGTNGVGSTLTNIYSKKFTVTTCDGKNHFTQTFSDNMRKRTAAKVKKSTKGFTEINYLIDFEKFAINTLDHSSALAQIKAANPQWIFATGYTNDLVLMRKQMTDQRIEAPVVTMIAAPAYQEFIDAAGKGAENISSAAWWHPAVRYKGIDIFGTTESYVKLFKDTYKADPDYAHASASVSGALFQIAIEKSGSIDRQKVRDELAKMDVITFWGPVKFGPTGQITSLEPPVFQIQNAKPIVVHPAAIKQGDLKIGVK